MKFKPKPRARINRIALSLSLTVVVGSMGCNGRLAADQSLHNQAKSAPSSLELSLGDQRLKIRAGALEGEYTSLNAVSNRANHLQLSQCVKVNGCQIHSGAGPCEDIVEPQFDVSSDPRCAAAPELGANKPSQNADFCAQYDKVKIIDLPLTEGGTVHTRDHIDFGPRAVVVVRFKAPLSSAVESANLNVASIVADRSSKTMRHVTLSHKPCDFREIDSSGQQGPITGSGGKSASAVFGKLKPGQTYYFNARNYDFDRQVSSCTARSCDATLTLNVRRQ